MEIEILIMYSVVFLMVVLIAFIHHGKNKILRKSIGEIFIKWSNNFNLSFWQGQLRWGLLIIALSLIVYWFIYHRDQNYGHTFIMSLKLVLSFYPWWTVKIGKKRVIKSMKIIYWSDVKSWDKTSGKNKILLNIDLDPPHSQIKLKIPMKYAEDIDDILIGSLSGKATLEIS